MIANGHQPIAVEALAEFWIPDLLVSRLAFHTGALDVAMAAVPLLDETEIDDDADLMGFEGNAPADGLQYISGQRVSRS